jgi:hypothetical protein
MDLSHRLIALPIALALATGALAAEGAADSNSAAASESVEKLKSRLGSPPGFQVEDVRVASSGAACIRYRLSTNTGGETHAKAVVQGEKVLRSTSRTREFEEAWNSQCTGAS